MILSKLRTGFYPGGNVINFESSFELSSVHFLEQFLKTKLHSKIKKPPPVALGW
jgi:hypothetical protein